jgi:hypothetical protein
VQHSGINLRKGLTRRLTEVGGRRAIATFV